MNKIISMLIIFVFAYSIASCRAKGELPEDAKWIANHGKIHFAYADASYLRREVELREIGKIICTEIHNHEDYCQVYFWSNELEVVTELPVIQRGSLFAIYEKNGEAVKLKRLKERL
ncbi:MAG: hypothetical protein SFT90_01060 [Rickettsiales bacterium]|nr:hypothetical protein [Rickettsiales bacterium]